MKKLSIIVCAVLIGASLLGLQKAEAATYVSMLATGSQIAWLESEYTTVADGDGYYYYDYTVYIKDFDTYTLPSGYTYLPDLQALKVLNSSHTPVELVESPSSPLQWNFAQDINYVYYQWTVNSYSHDLLMPTPGELDSMKIKSKFGPTYVGAAVWDGGLPTSSGNTVGPAPEPASLSLLGLSLLGLGGMLRRKFIA